MQLVVDKLHLRIKGKAVLQNISFSLDPGKVMAVVGSAGSGKTVLVECISGLRKNKKGKVYLRGEPIEKTRNKFSQLGIVFSRANFFPHINIYKNLSLALTAEQRKSDDIDVIRQVTERMRVSHLLESLPGDLHNWQLLQMQLVRALINKPDVLLLDSPFEQIPVGYHNALRVLIAEEASQGCSILFTTSSPRQAMQSADTIALLEQGHFLQTGTPNSFLGKPANIFVANMFFDQGLGVIRGEITRRLKSALDCVFLDEYPARLFCKSTQLLDYPGPEILVGIHADSISFEPSQERAPEFMIKGRLVNSRLVVNKYYSLWQVANKTLIESVTDTEPPGRGLSELWVQGKGSIIFNEHGVTLAIL